MRFRDNSIIFFEIDNFDLKNKSGIRWNHIAGALWPISIMRWACQHSFLSLLELLYALVPSPDNLASSDLEFERIATVDA